MTSERATLPTRPSLHRRVPRLGTGLLCVGALGCASVEETDGLQVRLTLHTEAAHTDTTAARLAIQTAELLPCPTARWTPAHLLTGTAHADHAVAASSTVLVASAPADLVLDGQPAVLALGTFRPTPGDYCTLRFVVEGFDGGPAAELTHGGTTVATTQPAWIDVPVTVSLSDQNRNARLAIAADVSRWSAAVTDAQPADALHQLMSTSLSLR